MSSKDLCSGSVAMVGEGRESVRVRPAAKRSAMAILIAMALGGCDAGSAHSSPFIDSDASVSAQQASLTATQPPPTGTTPTVPPTGTPTVLRGQRLYFDGACRDGDFFEQFIVDDALDWAVIGTKCAGGQTTGSPAEDNGVYLVETFEDLSMSVMHLDSDFYAAGQPRLMDRQYRGNYSIPGGFATRSFMDVGGNPRIVIEEYGAVLTAAAPPRLGRRVFGVTSWQEWLQHPPYAYEYYDSETGLTTYGSAIPSGGGGEYDRCEDVSDFMAGTARTACTVGVLGQALNIGVGVGLLGAVSGAGPASAAGGGAAVAGAAATGAGVSATTIASVVAAVGATVGVALGGAVDAVCSGPEAMVKSGTSLICNELSGLPEEGCTVGDMPSAPIADCGLQGVSALNVEAEDSGACPTGTEAEIRTYSTCDSGTTSRVDPDTDLEEIEVTLDCDVGYGEVCVLY